MGGNEARSTPADLARKSHVLNGLNARWKTVVLGPTDRSHCDFSGWPGLLTIYPPFPSCQLPQARRQVHLVPVSPLMRLPRPHSSCRFPSWYVPPATVAQRGPPRTAGTRSPSGTGCTAPPARRTLDALLSPPGRPAAPPNLATVTAVQWVIAASVGRTNTRRSVQVG